MTILRLVMKKRWIFFSSFILLGIIIFVISQLPPHWLKPDHLVNLSSILTLISFTVRSILFLRLLAIGAQLTFIPYCLLQSPPLWTPVFWNLLFLGVNVVNIILLLLERRPVKFSPQEKKLYQLAFQSLSPREFLRLVNLGEWREGKAGETLIKAGEVNTQVFILCSGEAVAFCDGQELTQISEGHLLGLSSVLFGDPMIVSIKLNCPSRYICWPIEPLRKFLDKRPELRNKMKSIVNENLVKIIRTLEALKLQERRSQNKSDFRES